MRGKAASTASTSLKTGITPAYAGKSLGAARVAGTGQDHPRVCGEKSKYRGICALLPGSPPRMRGKVLYYGSKDLTTRITPAYAGKSTVRRSRRGGRRDHPRVCGEKCHAAAELCGFEGSPPRMRGKAAGITTRRDLPGITPAYAGKRLKRSHSIGHFSCILCLFHSVLHRASVSDGSRAGPCAPPCLPAQNAVPV